MNQQLNGRYKQLPSEIVMYPTINDRLQKKTTKQLQLIREIEHNSAPETAEILQIAKELATSNRELKQVNQQLENFAYTVSHDLQEPLRSISLFAELLEEEYTAKLDEQGREYLRFITSSASRMQTLIRDVLAYSRVTKSNESWIIVDLNQLLDSILIDLQQIIRETKAKIVVDYLPTVLVNPTEISQLLRNLISNSLKFKSLEQPCIKVASKLQSDRWLIMVRDNGIGIEPEYRDKIFQPFTRLHSQEKYSGNGVGLAICQKIVERYQGIIGVSSQPGKGSVFYFTLPKLPQ